MHRIETDPLDADPRSAQAILHDVNNLLMTVASLVVQTRNTFEGRRRAQTRQAIEKLGCAVGETIQLARSGSHAPERGSFLPTPYISEHVAAFAGLFEDRSRFCITLHPDCSTTRIHMPKMDLLRVLTNLIRNAEQASPANGPVELELDLLRAPDPVTVRGDILRPGDYVSFRVNDRGHGFAARESESLEGTGEGSHKRSHGGRHGLGLLVATRLLSGEGGGLRVRAREGGGSTVEALVPTHPWIKHR